MNENELLRNVKSLNVDEIPLPSNEEFQCRLREIELTIENRLKEIGESQMRPEDYGYTFTI